MAKQREGKPRLSLVYLYLMEKIVEVREFGINKYGHREDWRTVPIEDYYEAAMRHMTKALDAFTNPKSEHSLFDDESGLLHLAHAATDIMFILEQMRTMGDELEELMGDELEGLIYGK